MARGKRSGEFERIARYFAPLAADVPGARGLRDDCAFLELPEGQELVVKTDAIAEGVHYLPDDPPELIARKALRVNLSDLAAKGAVPRWYLLNAAFRKDHDDAWVAAFARGLAKDQAEFNVRLVGGDTIAAPGPAQFSVTALGTVRATWGLQRSGAHAGDDIYVTGTIGDGALGLLARRGALTGLKPRQLAHLVERYRLPYPRVSLGHHLLGVANAALDISDGLVADLGHLCENSGLAATIEETRVPLSPAARAALADNPALIETVLTGGDDYEILFAAQGSAAKVLEHRAREAQTPITRIGTLAAGKGVCVVDGAGKSRVLSRVGWTHS